MLLSPERLAALAETELLDSPPEQNFDRYTRLASTLLGVPVALVSLVGADRQFFKSQVGLSESRARETPLSHSICQHVLTGPSPLIVEDAREHELLRNSPAVTDLGIVAYAGFPLHSPEGHALGAFCVIDARVRRWTSEELDVVRDLSEAVNAEIALRVLHARERKARQALEKAAAEKNNFLAMLGHELRNPLAVLRSAIDLFKCGYEGDPKRLWATLDRQANNLQVVIDDLLDVARVSHGKMELRVERLDLVEQLRHVAQERRAAGAGERLRFLPPEQAEVWVEGDPARLAQVFHNLLHNAEKFTPSHGRIELALECDESRVHVYVRDDGAGIAPELIPTICEPFRQAEQEPHRPQGGLGLGLALAHGLIHLHGGELEVRSDGVGQGTTVSVTLTRARS